MPLTKDQKEQRRVIAQMLCGKGGLNELCMKNRDALRYYQDFGELPERERITVKPTERVVEGDVYQLKENARKLAAKLRKKIKDAGESPNPDWLVKLKAAEQDFEFYKSKMNGSK